MELPDLDPAVRQRFFRAHAIGGLDHQEFFHLGFDTKKMLDLIWEFIKISMIFLEDFFGNSMGLLWDLMVI